MADWFTIDKNSGSGDGNVIITASSNTELMEKLANLKVQTINGRYKNVSIKQKAFKVAPDTLYFDFENVKVESVTISCSNGWEISKPDWVIINKTSGSGNDVIGITAEENSGGEREGQIVFTSGEMTRIINVTQSAYVQEPHPISIAPSMLEYGYRGGTKSVIITTDYDWVLVVPQGFTASHTYGSGNTEVQITALPNTLEELKIGTLVASTDTHSASVLLSQNAKPSNFWVNVAPSSHFFGVEGGNVDFVVSTNGDSLEWTTPTFGTLTHNEPYRSGEILYMDCSLEVGEEAEGYKRNGFIDFSYFVDSEKKDTSRFSYRQDGEDKPIYFEINPKTKTFNMMGGTTYIDVTTNLYEVRVGDPTFGSIRKTYDGRYALSVGNTFVDLTGYVTFEGYDEEGQLLRSETFTYTQLGNSWVRANPDSINLSELGGYYLITLTTDAKRNPVFKLTERPNVVYKYGAIEYKDDIARIIVYCTDTNVYTQDETFTIEASVEQDGFEWAKTNITFNVSTISKDVEDYQIKYVATQKLDIHTEAVRWGAEVIDHTYDETTKIGLITFNGSVLKIPEYEFRNNSYIKKIVIPSSVDWIQQYAFYRSGLRCFLSPDPHYRVIDFEGLSMLDLLEFDMSPYINAIGNCGLANLRFYDDIVFGNNLESLNFGSLSQLQGGYELHFTSMTPPTLLHTGGLAGGVFSGSNFFAIHCPVGSDYSSFYNALGDLPIEIPIYYDLPASSEPYVALKRRIIGADGGTIELNIKNLSSYRIYTDSEWITESGNSVVIEANTGGQREGHIEVYDENDVLIYVDRIYQEGATEGVFEVSPTYFSNCKADGSKEITITAIGIKQYSFTYTREKSPGGIYHPTSVSVYGNTIYYRGMSKAYGNGTTITFTAEDYMGNTIRRDVRLDY